jgi:hypothetical protein
MVIIHSHALCQRSKVQARTGQCKVPDGLMHTYHTFITGSLDSTSNVRYLSEPRLYGAASRFQTPNFSQANDDNSGQGGSKLPCILWYLYRGMTGFLLVPALDDMDRPEQVVAKADKSWTYDTSQV